MSTTHDDHDDAPPAVSPYAALVTALEDVLVNRGVFTRRELEEWTTRYGARAPENGARVVARAWVDPQFKTRLLKNSKAALSEMGFSIPTDPEIVVLEDTENIHHLVVCTLCSCYPQTLLGAPPTWYRSFAYRSRAVVDPRGVIREFGVELPKHVDVRVMDSTADVRYMVLPQRPKGTEKLSERELAARVTRDCLIGVALP